ncbi:MULTISPECIES: transcription antitermination factor NusB [Kocuria]|uniref:Transcription antitermination protein NusB n=2 Tax=Kocuria rosea TaxID=1275 RepID=A0A0A6YBI3_KOCRO|nr:MULTISPECIES: transcription antitermination factor NusB [Kocuria]MCC5784807.1 transcription antitermination factor NusB [Kocuria sp. CCUG 69068]NVC24932.1 transcription antitermination factor NusB [Kocuria salina]EYT55007.1 antitermination protein NusB [Kocuria sp. UCD-OTCP]KHD96807.1 antitermination protein NusB [Kocuria polaris]MCM3485564.1 transcription antitermination factor NusB [Kocuria rosea]
MSARGKARRRAVEILFEAEQRSEDAREVMERRRMHSDSQVSPYAEELVLGVTMRRGELDEYLETYSQGWTLERMPAVDRNVLRVGAWELLFNDDVPDGVAVAEAVSLAKELAGDDSPRFVNGLLGRLQQMKPTLLG